MVDFGTYDRLFLAQLQGMMQQRMADDPLEQFQPFPGQQRFIDSVLHSPLYENWAVCCNRWGKSSIGAYCGSHFLRYGISDPPRAAYGPDVIVMDRAVKMWVVGPDYQTLMHVLLPKYFDNGLVSKGQSHLPFIPEREISKWDKENQSIILTNGSIAQYKSNEQRAVKFSGAGVDVIHFDEEPPLDNYQESTLRVEAGSRLRIFGTCTLLPPEGQVGGVSWLYRQIIQPFLAGTNPRVGVFGGNIYENIHLDPEEIARLEAKYPEGSPQRRIRLGGEWLPGIGGARKYGNFQRQIHVCHQGKPNPHFPLLWTWDFNVSPLCSIVVQYVHGVFHVLRELIMDGGDVPEMTQAFRDMFPSHPQEIWIYGDQTGDNRHVQTGGGNYTLILKGMQTYGTPCRLRLPSVNPLVTDRVNAMNVACRGAEGMSSIEIDPSCVELIQDLEEVVDNGLGGIKKTSNRLDPYSRRTHTSDALGYLVCYEKPVRLAPRPSDAAAIPDVSYGFQRGDR